MGILEDAKAVIKAREVLMLACEGPCVCDSITLQRDICQCDRAKSIIQALFTLMVKIDALCVSVDLLEEESSTEQYAIDNPSVLLKVADSPFHCRCGGVLFKRFTNGKYQCNACNRLYEGE